MSSPETHVRQKMVLSLTAVWYQVYLSQQHMMYTTNRTSNIKRWERNTIEHGMIVLSLKKMVNHHLNQCITQQAPCGNLQTLC